MARTFGSPLNPWVGKVGGTTYYVRGGQQIMYARSGAKRRPVESWCDKKENAAMVAAQRWRRQLRDIGVEVQLSTLLDWAYSMQRVSLYGGHEYITTSSVGSWCDGQVSVDDGRLRVRATVRTASLGRQGWLYWGDDGPSGGQVGFESPWWYDFTRNIYPSGTLWLSVFGESLMDAQLVIGRRVDVVGNYVIGTRNSPASRVWAAYPIGERVGLIMNEGTAPKPYDYIYWVQGWASPSVMIEASQVLPFAILSAEGEPLEMAAFAANQ